MDMKYRDRNEIKKGLIEYLDGERTFKTTDKGMNFLCIHHKVQGLTTTKSQRREMLEDTSRGRR
jgi:predicted transcriptional regulator